MVGLCSKAVVEEESGDGAMSASGRASCGGSSDPIRLPWSTSC